MTHLFSRLDNKYHDHLIPPDPFEEFGNSYDDVDDEHVHPPMVMYKREYSKKPVANNKYLPAAPATIKHNHEPYGGSHEVPEEVDHVTGEIMEGQVAHDILLVRKNIDKMLSPSYVKQEKFTHLVSCIIQFYLFNKRLSSKQIHVLQKHLES